MAQEIIGPKSCCAHVVPAVEQLRSLLNEVSAHANEHVEKSVAK